MYKLDSSDGWSARVVALLVCVVLVSAVAVYLGWLSFFWMDRYADLSANPPSVSLNVTNVTGVNVTGSGVNLSVLLRAVASAVNESVSSLNVSSSERIASLLEEVYNLRRQNDILQDLVAGKNITGQCAEVINGLRAEIRELNDRVACLSSNISDLKGNISRLKGQVAFLSPYKEMYERAAANWSFYLNRLAPRNFSEYITPDDPLVKAKVREILGSKADGNLSWADMRNINLWVASNVRNPNFDLPPFGYNWSLWQYPAEVLRSGFGDSSDCARLAVSLMKAEDSSADYLFCAEFVFESFSRTVIVVNVELNQMVIYDPISGWQSNPGPELQVMDQYSSRMHQQIKHVPVAYDDGMVRCFYDKIKFLQWL